MVQPARSVIRVTTADTGEPGEFVIPLRRVAARLDRVPSLSAQVNAAQRAAESLRPPRRRLVVDPYARQFVRHPLLRPATRYHGLAEVTLRLFDVVWPGLHAHVVLRSRYADDVLTDVTRAGIGQVVVLGAGFDTSSLRHSGAAVTFFEVDAPTTQANKRRVVDIAARTGSRDHIVWVTCDFERDNLSELLTDQGFDPARPSLTLWLGVTPYLTRPAITAALTHLAEVGAPGSELILDHLHSGVVDGTTRSRGARRATRDVARRGEPYRTDFGATDLDACLISHGFRPVDRVTSGELLRRYDPDRISGVRDDSWLSVVRAQRVDTRSSNDE